MSEINPYAPPETNPVPSPQPGELQTLASPWIRLGAQIIDCLIVMAACFPVMWLFSRFGYGGDAITTTNHSFAFRMEGVFGQAVWLGVWIAVNWSALQNGQTLGKRVAGIRIVRKDGSPIPAQRIITHRTLPVHVVGLVPHVGPIVLFVDALMIFRSGRNTFHDDIADTKVIKLR